MINQDRRDKEGGSEYGITENTSNAGQTESGLNSKVNKFCALKICLIALLLY